METRFIVETFEVFRNGRKSYEVEVKVFSEVTQQASTYCFKNKAEALEFHKCICDLLDENEEYMKVR